MAIAARGQIMGQLCGQLRKFVAELPHILFFFVVLPIVLLFLLIPSSWYEAEGYADLGVVDFVASEVPTHVRRHGVYDHDVVYRATDGSGLSFREGATRPLAHAAVEAQQRLQRHVYISHQKPSGILRLFQITTGQIFLPLNEALQDYLDTGRRIKAAVYCVGFCYTAGYLFFTVLCHRRKRENKTPGRPFSP